MNLCTGSMDWTANTVTAMFAVQYTVIVKQPVMSEYSSAVVALYVKITLNSLTARFHDLSSPLSDSMLF